MGLQFHRNCPCCNSQTWHKTPLQVADYFHTQEVFEVHHCDTCGFKYTVDPPGPQDIGRYYDSQKYISHSNTEKGIVPKLYHRARQIMLHKKKKWVETHTAIKEKLLDIGAGTGYFSAFMRDHGWNVLGLEPDDGARQVAKDTLNLELQNPERLYSLPGKYDCITMWHVLEHIHDLDGYLRAIHAILAEDGAFIVAVPNYTSLDGQKYGQYWAAYDVPRHLWHFSPESMEELMGKHGFEVVNKYRMSMDPFYVSILSENYRKSSLGFVRGLWTGLRSHITSLVEIDRSSSIVYIMKGKEKNSSS